MSGSAVTVGIATLGRPEGLARCLEALRAQTVAPDRVVVVEQGEAMVARELVETSGLPNATYAHQARRGLSASRNRALELATGEILAVTDDDCVPDGGWVASVAAALDRPPPAGAVAGPVLPLGEQPAGMVAISLRESREAADHMGRVIPWGVGSGGNFAARTGLLRESGGWDERLGAGSRGQAAEDADLIYRLLGAGQTVRYDPAMVVRHDWQTRERRLSTRWSYGFGIGAMCGLWLAQGDLFTGRMLSEYARLHLRPLLSAVRRRDRSTASEHWRALASLPPGIVHGLRASRWQRRSAP